MSNAFISGMIANERFIDDFSLANIKQKYGKISDVDAFVITQRQTLRDTMLKMGLAQKHLDILFASDDTADEHAMIQAIKKYEGCKAGNTYRDTYLELYSHYLNEPVLDFELRFDEKMIQKMHPYLTNFVDVDGIVAHLYFRLIEIKNVAIVLKANHYQINPESRLRHHEF